MPTRWQRLAHLSQLVRIELALTAVSNAWLMVFLARGGIEPAGGRNPALFAWPPWGDLLITALVAAGLHTCGVALNDVVDARHDRAFSPERPIAAGRIGLPVGVVVSLAAVLVAMGAAVFLGPYSAFLCILATAAILFYNAAGKFLPATGILTLALIRAVNMFLPNPMLSFGWPIVLTMSHVAVCAAVSHRIESKRPRLHGAELWMLVAGWAFWTLALVAWMTWRQQELGTAGAGGWWLPVAAVGVFIVIATAMLRGRWRPLKTRRAAGAAFMRLAMLWMILFDAAWLAAAGLYRPAALHVGLFVLACVLTLPVDWLARTKSEPGYRVGPFRPPLPASLRASGRGPG